MAAFTPNDPRYPRTITSPMAGYQPQVDPGFHMRTAWDPGSPQTMPTWDRAASRGGPGPYGSRPTSGGMMYSAAPPPAHIAAMSQQAHDLGSTYGTTTGKAARMYDVLMRLSQTGHMMNPQKLAEIAAHFGGAVPNFQQPPAHQDVAGNQIYADYLRRNGLLR